MATVVFYELPRGAYWDGVARLVSYLVQKGKSVVCVESTEEAARLSKSLWDLPQAEMVPHGTLGVDADDDLDPVIIAVGAYDGPREILILASSCELKDASPAGLLIEPVPQDAAAKQKSRDRYKRYKQDGNHPTFVPLKKWAGG